MRKFLLGAVALSALIFLTTHLEEMQDLLRAMRAGSPLWLSLALLVQVGWLFTVAASFRSLYRLLGVRERWLHLFQLAAAAHFVSVITPSLGVGGMAVFVLDGRKRGHPSSRTGTAVALWVLHDYFGFFVVLMTGLFIMLRRGLLHPAEIGASAIFVGVAGLLATVIAAGMQSTTRLETVLIRLGGLANRLLRPFFRRDYLDLARARVFAQEVGDGLQQVRRSPARLITPALLALTNKLLLITILALVFAAYGQTVVPAMIVAAFSVGYLFLIVSPTPSGIGFVEGAMTLALTSWGLPLTTAAALALTYRGVTFWLPLAIGALAVRRVGRDYSAV